MTGPWKCLPCVVEHKGAVEIEQRVAADAPPMRDAITLLNGVPHCYEHIQVQRPSPLALPTTGSAMGGGL